MKTNLKKIIIFLMTFLMLASVSFGVLTDSNEAYWTLDNVLTDATGNGLTLTNNGATYTSSGKINGAYYFDGVNDYMNSTNILTVNAQNSISFWIKPNDLVNLQDVLNLNDAIGDSVIIAFNGTNIGAFTRISSINNIKTAPLSNTNWNFVVVTWSTNLSTDIYVNTITGTGTTQIGSGSTLTSSLKIGSRLDSTILFNGTLDEISFWSRVLTSTEITELYNAGTGLQYPYSSPPTKSIEQTFTQEQAGIVTLTGTNYVQILGGSFNITDNLVPMYGTTTLALLSNESNDISCHMILDGQNGTEQIRSNTAGNIGNMYILSDVFSVPNGTHDMSLECKKVGSGEILIGFASGVGHIMGLDNILISDLYMQYDLYDSANDSVSSGYDGTIVGDVYFNGLSGAEFDGTGDYITYGNVPELGNIDVLSISAFVKRNTIIDDNFNIVSVNNSFILKSQAGTFFMYVYDGSGYTTKTYGGLTAPIGEYAHVVMVYDKTNSIMKLYVDGVLVKDGLTGGSFITIPTSASDLLIGQYLNGAISNVRIFTKALNDYEVGLLYKNKTLNYQSGMGNTTITSGANYSDISSINFSTMDDINFEKTMVIEWGGEITNNALVDEELNVQITISDGTTSQTCKEISRYTLTGNTASVGGGCVIGVTNNTNYTVTAKGTGTNAHYQIFGYVKEFDLDSGESFVTNLSSISYSGANQTVKSFTITNNESNANLFLGLSSSVSDSGGDTTTYFRVYDGTTFDESTTSIPYTFNADKTVLVRQDAISIPTGTYTVDLISTCNSGTCTFDSGQIVSYMTTQLDFTTQDFLVQLFNDWNSSQIMSYDILTSEGTLYSTTNGNITINSGNSFLDLNFSSTDYIDNSKLNQPTNTNLNWTMWQSILNLNAQEIFTNISISNFSIVTSEGTFTTTNGTITIKPNIDSYTWDFTFPTYHNILNYIVNITLVSETLTIENVYDTLLSFQDSALNVLNPSCVWVGNTIINNYNVSAQNSLTEEIVCRLAGYVPYITSFTGTFPKTNTITLNESKIIVNVYNRLTGDLLNTSTVNINIDGLVFGTTTTGILTFTNTSFLPDTYSVTASSTGYYTEFKTFDYDAEEKVTISLYLLDTSYNQSSTLSILVVDSFAKFVPEANVKLEEFDISTQSWKDIGQCLSNSNGECNFLIEVGIKKYRVYATKLINGILQEDYSSIDGEIFQPDISNGEIIFGNLITRTLTLVSTPKVEVPIFSQLSMTYPYNENETIVFTNNTNYVLQVPITYSASNNLDYKICLEFYQIVIGQEQFITKFCSNGSSGTIPAFDYTIDRDNYNLVKITATQGNNYVVVKEYKYLDNDSLFYHLNQSNYVPSAILILWILLLTLSLYSKNVSVFVIGSFFIAILQVTLFPSFINLGGTVLTMVVGWSLFNMSRKTEDNI